MLRVAFVLRSTEVMPVFFDLWIPLSFLSFSSFFFFLFFLSLSLSLSFLFLSSSLYSTSTRTSKSRVFRERVGPPTKGVSFLDGEGGGRPNFIKIKKLQLRKIFALRSVF